MDKDEYYHALVSCGEITAERLEKGLSAEFGAGMNERYGRLTVDRGLWVEMLGLALHGDPRVAFRASWALEWAYFAAPSDFSAHTARFADNFLAAANPSVHRHFTKIMYAMLKDGRFVPDDGRAARIAEKAFDLLIDPDTRVAVKAWAMDILCLLAARLDWVAEHLPEVVEHQLSQNPSAGMTARGRAILRKLRAANKTNKQ